jgi:hypothetical protein
MLLLIRVIRVNPRLMFVPESGIPPVPQIVRVFPVNPPHQKISTKKDRNFLVFTEIPLGTTVVLEAHVTSRSARLN